MYRVKFICTCVVVALVCLVGGECYQLHQKDGGQIGYQISLDEITYDNIVKVLAYNDEPDVQIYLCEYLSGDKKVYCDDELREIIIKQCQIREGTTHSLFFGHSTWKFYSLSDYVYDEEEFLHVGVYAERRNSETLTRIFHEFDLMGESVPEYLSEDGAKVVVIAIIGALFLLFLGYYESVVACKQVVVSYVFGNNVFLMVMKRALRSVFLNCAALVAVGGIMHGITYIGYMHEATLLIFIVFVLLDAGMQFAVLIPNRKKVLNNALTGNMRVNRVLYTLTVICIVYLSSGFLQEIRGYCNSLNDLSFLADKKDMVAITQLDVPQDNPYTDRQYASLLYSEISLEHEVLEMTQGGNYASDPSVDCREIKINAATGKYLSDWITNPKGDMTTGDYLIILPEGEKITSEKMQTWKKELYAGTDCVGEPKVITYTGDCVMPAMNSKGRIEMVIAPIVLLSRHELRIENIEEAPHIYKRLEGCLIRISEDELQGHEQEYNIHVETTNVWEQIQEGLMENRMIVRALSLLLTLLFFAAFFILATIIRIDFAIRGMEICIGKITGTEIWRLMTEVLSMVLRDSLIAFLVACCLKHSRSEEMGYAFASSVIITCVCAATVMVVAKIQIKKNAVSILKRGAI